MAGRAEDVVALPAAHPAARCVTGTGIVSTSLPSDLARVNTASSSRGARARTVPGRRARGRRSSKKSLCSSGLISAVVLHVAGGSRRDERRMQPTRPESAQRRAHSGRSRLVLVATSQSSTSDHLVRARAPSGTRVAVVSNAGRVASMQRKKRSRDSQREPGTLKTGW